MSRETFGMQASTLYHNLHYNNRLQLVDIRVGDSSTDEWSWTRGALVYYYGTTARDGWNAFANSADNNGNVLRQVNYAPLSGGGYEIPQLDDYNYDALNRNTSVTEAQQNSAGTWTFNLFTQNFGYDRWGNRTVSCSPCQSGVTGDNFTVDTTTNRLTAKNGVGMTYDSAGNQTYDATGNRWFDGENKMYKAVQSGTTSYYVYDADGKRVRRIVGATETWMVYGINDELIAEYAANGASGSPQKEYGYRSGQMLIVAQTSPLEIRWTVPDHLGTPRMNIMGNGASGGLLSSVKRHDYLPFGEELFAGVGLRSSSSHGYEPPSDGVRQKFDGYERDSETGLDFAQARYNASVQGRFTSPDDFLNDTRTTDPASWNLYTYVRNNPLRYIDPTGEKIYVGDLNDTDREELLKRVNFTYGCESCVSAGKDGYLAINTQGLGKDILNATQYLTDAINTTDWYAQVLVSNNDPNVAFGEARPVRGAVPFEDDSSKKRNADLIVLDFGDDKHVLGDKAVKQTFLNTVFAHEVAHRYPTALSDPKSGSGTGPVVDAVNAITDVLGLPRRTSYISGKFADRTSLPFQVGEINKKGELKMKDKQILWDKRNVGGKGVN